MILNRTLSFRQHGLIAIAGVIICSSFTFAKSAVTPINVQAALIKNFTHLINWPKSHEWVSGSQFKICIYKSSDLLPQLEDIFSGKTIKGKTTTITNIDSPDLSDCDLAYIGEFSDDSIQPLLENAQALGVLTISSNTGFGEKGIHINFFERGENIAFELNKQTLDSAGFEVSPQLFRYAKIVK
ncbi:YfiR family protein [Alkalimarinus alittae]|uniref:YfiR family protein n=1 Tax=Alkalimarinus alittae TaxID=2961619 RepID=A0ABY6MYY2_9ALTE|nr:YfiR family protein [Alkalimarinus alittae]UZE95033.1 YfiR family protein [Alkalimarinus alittae]